MADVVHPSPLDRLLVKAGLGGLVPPEIAREVRLRRLLAAVAVSALSDELDDLDDLPRDAKLKARKNKRLERRMRAVQRHGDLTTAQEWERYLAGVDGALRVSRFLGDYIAGKADPPVTE